jgi:hypothetical protein
MHLVTSLVSQVRQALAGSGVALVFMDHAGAMSHVMLGTSADDEVLLSSRKLGIDIRAVAAVCDEIGILGYVDTPQRLRRMLASYVVALGGGSNFSVALRPLVPDCRSEAVFAEKVAAVLDSPAAGVSFYHYAMMPLDRLDWIRHALAHSGASS